MKLYHVTNAFIAQRLLSEPVFRAPAAQPAYPLGLHTYSFKKGYFLDQQTQNQGVKLVLQWTGKIEKRDMHDPREYAPNVLYVQYPWRCYVRDNQGMKNLRIIGLLDDGSGALPQQLGVNLTQGWLSAEEYQQVIRAKCGQYLKKYWQTCKEAPLYLTVVDPTRQVNQDNKADSRDIADHLRLPLINSPVKTWGQDLSTSERFTN